VVYRCPVGAPSFTVASYAVFRAHRSTNRVLFMQETSASDRTVRIDGRKIRRASASCQTTSCVQSAIRTPPWTSGSRINSASPDCHRCAWLIQQPNFTDQPMNYVDFRDVDLQTDVGFCDRATDVGDVIGRLRRHRKRFGVAVTCRRLRR
jgi:hypothetical protein